MVTIQQVGTKWEVRIDGRFWGIYATEAAARHNAPESGIDWN